MRIIYLTDFVRTVFVRVINSAQTIFNVGVSFCADFCSDKTRTDKVRRINTTHKRKRSRTLQCSTMSDSNAIIKYLITARVRFLVYVFFIRRDSVRAFFNRAHKMP